jgi:hypothetical protein
MATSQDHDQDISAGLVLAAGDLHVPEAVAEQTGGGGTIVPGNSGWSPRHSNGA